MTPAEARRQHRLFLIEGGEDLAIRRYAGTPRVPTDTPVLGKSIALTQKDVVGSVVLSDRKFVLLAEGEILGILPVTTADKLVRGGTKEMPLKRIDDEARRFAGELVALEIVVSG